MSYIFGKEQFLQKYKQLSSQERRNIWIIVHTSDESDIYLEDYSDWLTIGNYCNANKLTISKISLQYKSHVVDFDTTNADGVYLSKTAKGTLGGETKQCYSIGVLRENKIYRTLYAIPELIEDLKLEDEVENCLKEALVVYDKER
jgi:hypothetical protein